MSEAGAPKKAPLEYFPKMVNFYEDDKIFDLLDAYGPLGVTIYDCILTIVYSNGYFANLSKDKLSRMVIRKIGNKWIKSQKVVVQVIDYCADLGLIRKDLMLQNIITSEGIQKRYHKIAVKLMKRQLYSREYWLLDENGWPLLSEPKSPNVSEENGIISEEINHASEEIRQKQNKTKPKETKNHTEPEYVPDERLNRAILDFVEYRRRMKKPMGEKAIELMIKRLSEFSESVDDQIRILEQSIINGWQGVFPLKKQEQRSVKPQPAAKENQFHNFDQRDTDYNALMMEQVQGWIHGEDNDG